jgi:hypothetical protein
MFALLVAVGLALTSCGGSGTSHKDATMTSFDGQWHAKNFDATINGNSIEIQLKYDDSSSLYWKGSFPQDTDVREITSVADKAALENSILGSQDSTKVFTIDGDNIVFEMSMLGTTRTVHLKKV